MHMQIDQLWSMPEVALVGTYRDARRLFAEKKFTRDTERARLAWLRARAFSQGTGGVSERTNAADANEEFARKGQHVRELTLELDLLKCDIDIIASCLRFRGLPAPSAKAEDHREGGFEEDDRPADQI